MGESNNKVEHLPLFKDTSSTDHLNLFLRKISLCSTIFEEQTGHYAAQGVREKHRAFSDMINFLNDSRSSAYISQVMSYFIKMISTNLFRTLRTSQSVDTDPFQDVPTSDMNWKTRQYLYELLLRFVLLPDLDVKFAKKYLNSFFVANFLLLLDVDDIRERDYLKTILHRIYARFMGHRTFIRKSIMHIFHEFLYQKDRKGGKYRGISELLEILGSIINGFALPLKSDHLFMLSHVLLPMYKSFHLNLYHHSLTYCIIQYVEKDPNLTVKVVRKLLRWWPKLSGSKQILFIATIEDILPTLPVRDRSTCVPQLLKRIVEGVRSYHFQVAEKSLLFLGSHHSVSLVTEQSYDVVCAVFDALYWSSMHHWNPTITSLATDTLRLYMELDPKTFGDGAAHYKKRRNFEAKRRKKHEQNWKFIEESANNPINNNDDEQVSSSESDVTHAVSNQENVKNSLKWTGSVSKLETFKSKASPLLIIPVDDESRADVKKERGFNDVPSDTKSPSNDSEASPISESSSSGSEMVYYLSVMRSKRSRHRSRSQSGSRKKGSKGKLNRHRSMEDLISFIESQPEELEVPTP
ncbi:hypothetical protein P9112_000921 [Eukaryota sp. TZLM1-RC]